MQRREYLGGIAAIGATATGGCLVSSGEESDVVLPEPDRQVDSSDLPYLAWGERIPDVTVPEPLQDREVTLTSVEKPKLLTFFYSHCQTVCPVLIAAMQTVQTHTINNNYSDQVEFFPHTFDPERDDAERLEQYAGQMNVDTDVGNWHFLRPESKDRAKETISEKFGVAFERTHPEEMDVYMFQHVSLTLLVNGNNYVERAYRTKAPDSDRIISDLAEVRTA